MKIQIVWDDAARTILRHTYQPGWTLDDYHHLVDVNHEMLMSVDHCVDIISDFTDSRTTPTQLISAMTHMENRLPRYEQVSVLVQAPFFIRIMVESGLRLMKGRNQRVAVRFATSLEEARFYIEQFRATTPRRIQP
jgi:hypothetical protein